MFFFIIIGYLFVVICFGRWFYWGYFGVFLFILEFFIFRYIWCCVVYLIFLWVYVYYLLFMFFGIFILLMNVWDFDMGMNI